MTSLSCNTFSRKPSSCCPPRERPTLAVKEATMRFSHLCLLYLLSSNPYQSSVCINLLQLLQTGPGDLMLGRGLSSACPVVRGLSGVKHNFKYSQRPHPDHSQLLSLHKHETLRTPGLFIQLRSPNSTSAFCPADGARVQKEAWHTPHQQVFHKTSRINQCVCGKRRSLTSSWCWVTVVSCSIKSAVSPEVRGAAFPWRPYLATTANSWVRNLFRRAKSSRKRKPATDINHVTASRPRWEVTVHHCSFICLVCSRKEEKPPESLTYADNRWHKEQNKSSDVQEDDSQEEQQHLFR